MSVESFAGTHILTSDHVALIKAEQDHRALDTLKRLAVLRSAAAANLEEGLAGLGPLVTVVRGQCANRKSLGTLCGGVREHACDLAVPRGVEKEWRTEKESAKRNAQYLGHEAISLRIRAPGSGQKGCLSSSAGTKFIPHCRAPAMKHHASAHFIRSYPYIRTFGLPRTHLSISWVLSS